MIFDFSKYSKADIFDDIVKNVPIYSLVTKDQVENAVKNTY